MIGLRVIHEVYQSWNLNILKSNVSYSIILLISETIIATVCFPKKFIGLRVFRVIYQSYNSIILKSQCFMLQL
jgi:hypothetical protein